MVTSEEKGCTSDASQACADSDQQCANELNPDSGTLRALDQGERVKATESNRALLLPSIADILSSDETVPRDASSPAGGLPENASSEGDSSSSADPGSRSSVPPPSSSPRTTPSFKHTPKATESKDRETAKTPVGPLDDVISDISSPGALFGRYDQLPWYEEHVSKWAQDFDEVPIFRNSWHPILRTDYLIDPTSHEKHWEIEDGFMQRTEEMSVGRRPVQPPKPVTLPLEVQLASQEALQRHRQNPCAGRFRARRKVKVCHLSPATPLASFQHAMAQSSAAPPVPEEVKGEEGVHAQYEFMPRTEEMSEMSAVPPPVQEVRQAALRAAAQRDFHPYRPGAERYGARRIEGPRWSLKRKKPATTFPSLAELLHLAERMRDRVTSAFRRSKPPEI
jgi:hypothetical protein